MSMSGGISFFNANKADYSLGASVVASSNQEDAKYLLSNDRSFRWVSQGSDDSTTETLTISFSSQQELSRLFLINHNFKSFSITYGADQEFTNVKGIDGTLTGINETDFSYDTAYYEFDNVVTDTINISVDTTQVSDAEKQLVWLILTSEIGTLLGFPDISSFNLDRNERKQKNAQGGQRVSKNRELASLKIDMNVYPYQEDIDLITALTERDAPFLVWPSGGMPSQFKLQVKGFRLRDIYLMQTTGKFQTGFYKNIYVCGAEHKITLEEVDR